MHVLKKPQSISTSALFRGLKLDRRAAAGPQSLLWVANEHRITVRMFIGVKKETTRKKARHGNRKGPQKI